MADRAIDPGAVAVGLAQMLPARSTRDVQRILECLCDPTRLKMVRALQDGAELAAGDLALIIGRSRSATSQHLRVLREATAVDARRERNVIRYQLSQGLTADVLSAIGHAFDLLAEARANKA